MLRVTLRNLLARKPRCGSCIIEDLCEYKEKVYPES